jgi:transcriptional regulator with XRE-family HTH domain
MAKDKPLFAHGKVQLKANREPRDILGWCRITSNGSINMTFNELLLKAVPEAKRCLATNLRELRLSSGMSQGELAKLAGVKQNTISEIEGEKTSPNYETLVRIALSLKSSISQVTAPVSPDNVCPHCGRSPLGKSSPTQDFADTEFPSGQPAMHKMSILLAQTAAVAFAAMLQRLHTRSNISRESEGLREAVSNSVVTNLPNT